MDITKKDHLRKVFCKIENTKKPILATIFVQENNYYLIHNNKYKNGDKPSYLQEWQKYGKYSWKFKTDINNPEYYKVTNIIFTDNQIHEL